jgi:carbon starvation protein
MIFNDRLDAGLALFFMSIVVVILLASAREWILIAAKKKAPSVKEAPYVETRLAT